MRLKELWHRNESKVNPDFMINLADKFDLSHIECLNFEFSDVSDIHF